MSINTVKQETQKCDNLEYNAELVGALTKIVYKYSRDNLALEFLNQLFDELNKYFDIEKLTTDLNGACIIEATHEHLNEAIRYCTDLPQDNKGSTYSEYSNTCADSYQKHIIDAIKRFVVDIQNIPLSQQTVSQSTKNIEMLRSILPANYIKPNNKLANEITRDAINVGKMEIVVSGSKAKKEIITKAILTYDDKNISLSGRAKFTPYDREVHDAVVTLYVAGNDVVTPEMVYRAMNGMTATEFISPQAVGAVTRSLDKSRRVMVNIDFSQEAQAYKKDCKATYEGYLLACDKVTVSTGGTTKEAYRLLRKPILYDYSQISGQIINVPIKLLQTKGSVRSTDDVIVIRGYLLRQIEGMKSRSFKRSNKVTFEGIYNELDVSVDIYNVTAYKNKTRTIRKHVDAILSEWIKQNYIKGYSQYKEGKTIRGVTITI